MKTSPRPVDMSAARSPQRDSHLQQPATSAHPEPDQIAQRAYQRFEARGREHGRDMEDWFEAERELEQGVSPQTTAGGDEDANSDEAA